jgi:hypothetical protein
MFRKVLALLVLAMLLSASMALAQGSTPRLEIRPFLGFRAGGNVNDGSYDYDNVQDPLIEDLSVKPSAQFGISIGVPVALLGAYDPENHIHLEVFWSTQSSTLRLDDGGLLGDPTVFNPDFVRDGDYIELADLDVHYLHLGGLYQWTGGDWNPYMNFSMGATVFAPEGDIDSKSKFSMGLGGGVKRFFTEHIAGRIQLRGFATFLGTDDSLWCNYYGHCYVYESSVTFTQFEISTGLTFAF